MSDRPRLVGILATVVLPVGVVVVRTLMNLTKGGGDEVAIGGLYLPSFTAGVCAGYVSIMTLIRHGDLGRHGRMPFLDYVEAGLAAVSAFLILSLLTKASLNQNGKRAVVVLVCATVLLYLLIIGRANIQARGN